MFRMILRGGSASRVISRQGYITGLYHTSILEVDIISFITSELWGLPWVGQLDPQLGFSSS